MFNNLVLVIAVVFAALGGANSVPPPPEPAYDPCPSTCLPKLCTDHATISGEATHLTYLCPEKTKEVKTVHTTVFKTVTVTPTVTETLEGPPAPGTTDEEGEKPTDSTEVSESTAYLTKTVHSAKPSPSTIVGPPSSVEQGSSAEFLPSSLKVITESSEFFSISPTLTQSEDSPTETDDPWNTSDLLTFTDTWATYTDDLSTYTDDLSTYTDDLSTYTDDLSTYTEDLSTYTDDPWTNTDDLLTFTDNLPTNTDDVSTFTVYTSTSTSIPTLSVDLSLDPSYNSTTTSSDYFPTLTSTSPVNGTTSGIFYTRSSLTNSSFMHSSHLTVYPTGVSSSSFTPLSIFSKDTQEVEAREVIMVHSTVHVAMEEREARDTTALYPGAVTKAMGKGGADRVGGMSLAALAVGWMVAALML